MASSIPIAIHQTTKESVHPPPTAKTLWPDLRTTELSSYFMTTLPAQTARLSTPSGPWRLGTAQESLQVEARTATAWRKHERPDIAAPPFSKDREHVRAPSRRRSSAWGAARFRQSRIQIPSCVAWPSFHFQVGEVDLSAGRNASEGGSETTRNRRQQELFGRPAPFQAPELGGSGKVNGVRCPIRLGESGTTRRPPGGDAILMFHIVPSHIEQTSVLSVAAWVV